MPHSGHLATTFVVTDRSGNAEAVDVTDTFWQDLDVRYGDFAGRTLISSFEFSEAWPTWEMHPAGDELVCLLEGEVELILAESDADHSHTLDAPGQFVVIPRGVWHTARPIRPTKMLFVTPGQGTENRPEPPGRS